MGVRGPREGNREWSGAALVVLLSDSPSEEVPFDQGCERARFVGRSQLGRRQLGAQAVREIVRGRSGAAYGGQCDLWVVMGRVEKG